MHIDRYKQTCWVRSETVLGDASNILKLTQMETKDTAGVYYKKARSLDKICLENLQIV